MFRFVAIAVLIATAVSARLVASDVQGRTPPLASSLNGVACTPDGACISVGSVGSVYGVRVPFAVVSADGGWRAESPPPPVSRSGDVVLSAVDCVSHYPCIAVGRRETPTPFFGSRSAGNRPLIATRDGDSWRLRSGLAPKGATDAGLNGIACVGSRCMAVGEYRTRSKTDRTLAESWDGTSWTLHLPPNPRFTEDVEDVVLQGVACVSATDCTAVGQFGYELEFLGRVVAPLIYRWDGTAWRPERAVSPDTSQDTELNAVACPSARRCVAVGIQRRPGGGYGTFAEVRAGDTWKPLPTRDPPGRGGAELSDVACPRPDRCTAVGWRTSGPGFAALAESWDGLRWRIEPVPTPAGSTSSLFTGIDCVRSNRCFATGLVYHGSPVGRAFSGTWNGRDWTLVPVPGPPQGSAQPL